MIILSIIAISNEKTATNEVSVSDIFSEIWYLFRLCDHLSQRSILTGLVAQLDVRLTDDQEVAGSTPARSATS